MDRERPLLDRYLDQLAGPGELRELSALLPARPDLADELVRSARTEALIEDLLRERTASLPGSLLVRPAPKTTARRAWPWAVAASLLLALGAVGGAVAYRLAKGDEGGAPRPSVVVSGQLLVDGAPADRALDGARLEVTGDSAAVVHLPDGSRAELAPGSLAVTRGPEDGIRRAVGLDRGRATFSIEQGAERFRVDTPLGSVTSLAGDFSVELQPVKEEERMSGRGELLLIVAALVGQVEVESLGRHYTLSSGQSVALASEGPARPHKPAFGGTVVAVSADGKTLTLEAPPAKPTGKATRRQFKLTARTEIVCIGLPRDGHRPTVGYSASVWLVEGSTDTVALLRLGFKGTILTGVVTAVAPDGKTVTVGLGPGKPGAPTSVEVKIVTGTKVVYREVEKGDRPTVGYFVQVWLQRGSRDTASGITFSSKKPTKPAGAAKPAGPDKPKPVKKPMEAMKSPVPAKAAPVRPARDIGPAVALIDGEVNRHLAAARVPASPAADDAEFLRRVTLDLTGRVPTYQQTVAFLADRSPDKRRQLIDELLASPAYGEHFATVWRHLLIPPVAGSTKRPRDIFSPWLAEQFNAGRGWGAIVTDMLTAEGPIAQSPQSAFLMANSDNFQPQPNRVAGSVSRLFLGTQLRCAECHNHPHAKWTQTDFWGMAAFFGGTQFTGFKGKPAASLLEKAGGGSIVLPAMAGKRSGQVVKARFLGGAEPRLEGAQQVRPRFAAWVTSADNPFFARAAVNRAWAHFFGRGLVSPVDDLDASEPSHPTLLTRLAREYAASGFDPKHLARCICNSKAYQRSSRPVVGNEKDASLFSHMALKPLSPEAFCDALAVVLSASATEPVLKAGKPRATAMAAVLGMSREDLAPLFRSQGEAESSTEPNQRIPQRLLLLNGPILNRPVPIVARLAKTRAPREEAITTLYLAALSRRPTPREVSLMSGYVARRRDALEGYRGVLWMLLNSSEFALNH